MSKTMNRNNLEMEPTTELHLEKTSMKRQRSLSAPRAMRHAGGDMASQLHLPSTHTIDTNDESLSYINIENSYDGDSDYAKRETCCGQMGSKLKAELTKYKKELKEYNNTTMDLKHKYQKINLELNELQLKHNHFETQRKRVANNSELYLDNGSCSSGNCDIDSEYSLKHKYTQVFESFNSENTTDQQLAYLSELNAEETKNIYFNQNCIESPQTETFNRRNREILTPYVKDGEGLKDIFDALKNVINCSQKCQYDKYNENISQLQNSKEDSIVQMQTIIHDLEQERSRNKARLEEQQNSLRIYHARCVKAHHIMKVQKIEIEKLNVNNHQLESDFATGIDQLRKKIDAKLRDLSSLPQMVREEQLKNDKMSRENKNIVARLHTLQNEALQLKQKLEDLTRRKASTITRLRCAERDLKIFKNQNTALKTEKNKMLEQLKLLNVQLEQVQNNSKRLMARQRDQHEILVRDLQKRIYELEQRLSRSHSSSSGQIQERDKLILELQSQLNTLVHNFEVSQKHIRVLRRHIYNSSNAHVTKTTAPPRSL